jgi:S-DNA-T family DNA segregation ATPase FtsK/SpoIIIE
MLEQRNLKVDLLALILLALTVFLSLSLVTYDPADPPSAVVYPPHDEAANLGGPMGAAVSAWLLSGVGLGGYYLAASLGVLGSVLLVRRQVEEPVLRGIGWILSLAGGCTFLAMALPGASPGPVIGSGGYLGAMGRHLLESNFATAGSYVLVLSIILGGLLLCTDYVLVHLGAWLFGTPAKGLTRGMARARDSYSLRKAGAVKRGKAAKEADDDANDEDEWEYEDEDDESAEYEEDEYEDDYEYEDDEVEEDEDAEEEDAPDEEAPVTAPRIVSRNDEPDSDAREEPISSAKSVAKRLAGALKIRPAKRDQDRENVIEELEAASRHDPECDYELPPLDILFEGEEISLVEQKKDVRRKARILEKTFAEFGFKVKVVEIETGPVIAQFEIQLEAGLRLSKITSLADDLAIALRVPSVRIVAPIPGKNTVGVEVPNAERQLVRLREVMEETNSKVRKMKIPLYLGKDVSGNPLTADLASLPHLLIAGRTGTGKSVCLNTIIMSMLMTRRPDDVRMLMIDPKMVELSPYMRLPHLMHPVITDMKKAEAVLAWAVEKMEERYRLLANAGVRHITSYNQLGEEELMKRLQPADEAEKIAIPRHLPFIVIVADEMADLMMTSAKEVESHIIRLAQKSRAVGIHLVLATQKPTVDVITGLIKSNLPARISFQVASRTDSRVVLDEMGADKLLGNGDMLFLGPGTSVLQRGQGAFISDEEVTSVVDFVATTEQQFVHELVQLPAGDAESNDGQSLKNRDELYEQAVDVIVREGRGSVSLLQRNLGIGYGRAARLIDFMEEDGIVGSYNGSQAREVLLTPDQWQAMSRGEDDSAGSGGSSGSGPAGRSTGPGTRSGGGAGSTGADSPSRQSVPRPAAPQRGGNAPSARPAVRAYRPQEEDAELSGSPTALAVADLPRDGKLSRTRAAWESSAMPAILDADSSPIEDASDAWDAETDESDETTTSVKLSSRAARHATEEDDAEEVDAAEDDTEYEDAEYEDEYEADDDEYEDEAESDASEDDEWEYEEEDEEEDEEDEDSEEESEYEDDEWEYEDESDDAVASGEDEEAEDDTEEYEYEDEEEDEYEEDETQEEDAEGEVASSQDDGWEDEDGGDDNGEDDDPDSSPQESGVEVTRRVRIRQQRHRTRRA